MSYQNNNGQPRQEKQYDTVCWLSESKYPSSFVSGKVAGGGIRIVANKKPGSYRLEVHKSLQGMTVFQLIQALEAETAEFQNNSGGQGANSAPQYQQTRPQQGGHQFPQNTQQQAAPTPQYGGSPKF